MQNQIERTPGDAEAFAFEHLEALAQLLHGAGHRDMAVLLDGMGDMHRLAQRRAAKGQGADLLSPRDEVVDYALDQLNDLARMMDEHGLSDAAFLLRAPAKLQAAADRRRGGEGAEIYVLPTARPPVKASVAVLDPASARARNVG